MLKRSFSTYRAVNQSWNPLSRIFSGTTPSTPSPSSTQKHSENVVSQPTVVKPKKPMGRLREGWLKTEPVVKGINRVKEPTRVAEPFIIHQTPWLAVSPQKINEFSRFIAKCHNLNEAIVQATYSKKGIARPIAECLMEARTLYLRRFNNSDVPLNERLKNLVIKRTWIQKGPQGVGVRIHGRGRAGVLHHRSAIFRAEITEVTPYSTERTLAEKKRAHEEKKFRKMIRGGVGKNQQLAGVVRDDQKLWDLPKNYWMW